MNSFAREPKMADIEQPQDAISPIEGRIHIYFDDAEIASTVHAVRLASSSGVDQIFVPLEAVHPGILEASETRREEPGKGEAHFYTIKTLTADGEDEAWYYPHAEGQYEPIRDLLTFAGARIRIEVSDV
jgi:uncharacterized protein (DUF427 family)